MKESTPPVLKVSLPEAEELLQAEALEAHPPMGWSAAESDAASRDALAVAGKSDIQAFLLTRAKLVLSRMTKHDPSLKRPRLPHAWGRARCCSRWTCPKWPPCRATRLSVE